jgi:hypothetical protein
MLVLNSNQLTNHTLYALSSCVLGQIVTDTMEAGAAYLNRHSRIVIAVIYVTVFCFKKPDLL